MRLDPLGDKFANPQPRLSESLRVSAPIPVHVVAVGGAVDVDGRRLRRDVLQHSHRVPGVDRPVDEDNVVDVRVHSSVSE